MKKIWRHFVGTVLLGAVVLALIGVGYVYWSGRQAVLSGSGSFVISAGAGVKQVANKLVQAGIIEEPYTFILWAYFKDYTRRIHAGEYRIPEGISVEALLERFAAGKVIQRSVTLIEGLTFGEFRRLLYTADKLRIETRGLSGEQIMQRLNAPYTDPEGRFFPDTYNYTADMSDLDVLDRARVAMDKVLEEEWRERGPDLAVDNKDDALVLASIIEKETGRPDERRTISAVFHNRLKKGMRLQTDPTVIYGLGADFDGNLTRAHLETDTPYNTYTRAGLPPTPIAMPGRAAIHAALNPGASEALYFVSRGDGSHVFSKTLEEHNRAVNEYQLNGGHRSVSGSGNKEPRQ